MWPEIVWWSIYGGRYATVEDLMEILKAKGLS